MAIQREQISPIERAKQLREELAQVEGAAREEALARARAAVDELNQLGVQYELREAGMPRTARQISGGDGSTAGRKGTRQVRADRPCPVCKFVTEPPHDGRRHKGHPAPFTDEELEQQGMRRVG